MPVVYYYNNFNESWKAQFFFKLVLCFEITSIWMSVSNAQKAEVIKQQLELYNVHLKT